MTENAYVPPEGYLQSEQLCSICSELVTSISYELLPTKLLAGLGGAPGERPFGLDVRRFDGSYVEGPPLGHYSNHCIGSLALLRERGISCKLCRFLVRILEKFELNERFSWDREDVNCFLERQQIGNLCRELQRFPASTAEGYMIHRYNIKLGKRDELAGAKIYGGIQIGPPMQADPRESTKACATFTGRLRSLKCDLTRFRSWIAQCDKGHFQRCYTKLETPDRSIRLIDVSSRCLRTIKACEAVQLRYLALSYVWGTSGQKLLLTKSNVAELHLPGGVKGASLTIEDACKLVEMLDERYLWVDCLCILQDDPNDMSMQISLMQIIYAGSYLTIIAAAGNTSEAGLPGIYKDRPAHVVEDFKDFSLLCTTAHFDESEGNILRSAHWNQRAWTFQEHLLSHRCLIFLPEQVAWTCRSANWFEDMDLEDDELRFYYSISTRHPGGAHPEDLFTLHIDHFHELVKEYTRRQLTKDGDIINAFSGIMDALPASFIWGLPRLQFDQFLCWTHQFTMSTNSTVTGRRRTEFAIPSYSWMAWKGHIDLRYRNDPVTEIERVCCHQLINNKLHRIQSDSKPIDQNFTCTLDDIPRDVNLDDSQLVFWANLVHLEVRLTQSEYGGAHFFELYLPSSSTSTTEQNVGRYFPTDQQNLPDDGSVQDFICIAKRISPLPTTIRDHLLFMHISWRADGVAEREGTFETHDP